MHSQAAYAEYRFDGRDARRVLRASPADVRAAVRTSPRYRDTLRYLELGRRHPGVQAAVPGNSYSVNTGTSAIALTGATAKTVLYINVGTANQPAIIEWCFSFDGVTASNTPALIELCYGTAASNSTPGTASTSFTPLQERGWPAQSSQQTAAVNCTSEPTVLVVHKQWLVTPNGGLLLLQLPMGREHTGNVTAATTGKQLAWRITAPQAVNVRGYTEYEE